MRRLNPTVLALLGLLALLLLLWAFSASRDPDQDKLTGATNQAAEVGAAEKRCASKATYDLIKRELFRRAAQVRGSDQSAFDRLSAYAVLRMENPVMESEDSDTGAVNCSGSLSLDLPPGVQVVGGRKTLTADVDYVVQRTADSGSDTILLRNADAIVTPLATLARTANTDAPTPGTVQENTDPLAPLPNPGAVVPAEPAAPATPPSGGGARPSFNCADARTRGETAVCSDPALAGLDRQMAAQFGRAMGEAGPGERALLERTRGRFLSYRDSCRSNGCIADAYRGRMREIDDIMAGRWRQR